MKKKGWIVLGVVLLATAVAAVLLLRRPPLIHEDGVESIVMTVTGQGHKEITDPTQQEEVLKLLNAIQSEKAPEDKRAGWRMAVYVFYTDGSQDTMWFTYHSKAYTDENTGITIPSGEYMSRYLDGNYHVKDGTLEALKTFCDTIDKEYTAGILPKERMQEEGLID